MEEEKKRKMKSTNQESKDWIGIAVICVLLIIVVANYAVPKIVTAIQRETLFCHFEKVVPVNSGDLPRYECVEMKIVSKDMPEIRIGGMFVNDSRLPCYGNYDSLPECKAVNYFHTSRPISSLENKEIDGYVCAAYYVDFFVNDTIEIDYYLQSMQEQFNTSEELRERLFDCKGD